jgi:anti-anti-sigma regulatory factor
MRVAMSDPHIVELRSSSPAGLRAQTTAAVNEVLVRERATLLLGLDSLSIIDDAVIAALIVALRRLREIGGTVRLITGNAEHRERLARIGLDRVFDIAGGPEEADRRGARSQSNR